MLPRLPRVVIALALASSIGLHWVLIQSAAWVSMVVSYSQGTTLKEALAKTFDGRHPCQWCLKIAAAKKAEKRADQQIEGKDFQFLKQSERFVFVAPNQFSLLPSLEAFGANLPQKPPVPPPRRFCLLRCLT